MRSHRSQWDYHVLIIKHMLQDQGQTTQHFMVSNNFSMAQRQKANSEVEKCVIFLSSPAHFVFS